MLIYLIIVIIFLSNKCEAISVQEFPELNGRFFFVKNAFTGQYLNVSGETIQAASNIEQYEYNGLDAQLWYIYHFRAT